MKPRALPADLTSILAKTQTPLEPEFAPFRTAANGRGYTGQRDLRTWFHFRVDASPRRRRS